MSVRRTSSAAPAEPSGDWRDRRVPVVVGGLFLTWGLLFAILPPLLPTYRDDYGLSQITVGLLAGASGAGLVLGALVAGAITDRIGPRGVVGGSAAVLAVTCVGFGNAPSVETLLLWRVLQGLAGGLVWSGGLVWLMALASGGRTGQLAGNVFALENAGLVLGPAIGAAALSIGAAFAFEALALLAGGLAILTVRLPATVVPRRERSTGTPPGIWAPLAVLALLGAGAGVVNSRAPIELAAHDVRGEAIGLMFLAGAAIATMMALLMGRLVDGGRTSRSLSGGLVASVVLLTGALSASSGAVLGLLCVGWIGVAYTLIAIPTVARAYEIGSRADGMAWTAGATVIVLSLSQAGGAAAAGLLVVLGDAVPFAAVAVVHAAMVVAIERTRRAPVRS